MIEVRGLVKSFGSHMVLRHVDLHVPQGRRLAVVGPNGAGKTTLFRILATLGKPTSGMVRVAGLDPANDAGQVRRSIGFISHHPLLYDFLSGEENLRFYGRMYQVPELDRRIDQMLGHVGMSARRHELVRTCSRGMRQRLAIARALLHDPPILLLDEPYTGLDQQAEETLDALLADDTLRTIMLSTHNLEQGLRLGHAIAILCDGEIAHQMNRNEWDPEGFRALYRAHLSRRVN